MRGGSFDETAFFSAISASGARALLIGRRALVLMGLPLLTADYDFWIAVDDIECFNRALEPFDLIPTISPEQARQRGRYVLQNDEHIDVIVARALPLPTGESIVFDHIWTRRQAVSVAPDAVVAIPSLDDLVATKRVGNRPKDVEDIRQLQVLKGSRAGSD
ncbi:MAG: hypothetical protein JSU08_12620 [Acidobacteria bacterium]|nr:hypothetical protein [Acidobacteriota bacterium]